MSFFPQVVASEFAPVFRLLDDYASHATARSNGFSNSIRSFQPRFDVKETKDSYELQGEFPGIDQRDITVEWTDAQQLTVKGRTERQREEGSRPAALVEGETQKPAVTEGESDGYHKASVEDEATESTLSADDAEATPAETLNEGSVAEPQTETVTEAPKTEKSKFWVSERSVGQFQRTFSFPNRIDQENVKASLKNGILSVVIPKAAAPENRRINIE